MATRIEIRTTSTPTPAPVGATLIKTGQTISYRTGDDGDLESGRATDFLTLASNNPFGNTNRFTDELGGSAYTNSIVIDWSTYNGSTVLGYYIGSTSVNRTWDAAIDWAIGLNISSFTSWRLCNINELFNIFRNGVAMGDLNYAPFNLGAINIWTSTTQGTLTTAAINRATTGLVATTTKTVAIRTIATRDFTVTGTTLT